MNSSVSRKMYVCLYICAYDRVSVGHKHGSQMQQNNNKKMQQNILRICKKGVWRKDMEQHTTTTQPNMMFLSWEKCFLFLILSQRIQYESRWNNGLLRLATKSNKQLRLTGTMALTVLRSVLLTWELQMGGGRESIYAACFDTESSSRIPRFLWSVFAGRRRRKGWTAAVDAAIRVVWVWVCVFDSKMAPTFHSPLSLPLLTSAALRFIKTVTQ